MSKKTKPQRYITAMYGKPGTGKGKATFANGLTSDNLMTAQFFMKMQDEDKSLADVRAYIRIGPMMQPAADWEDIARIADGFAAKATAP